MARFFRYHKGKFVWPDYPAIRSKNNPPVLPRPCRAAVSPKPSAASNACRKNRIAQSGAQPLAHAMPAQSVTVPLRALSSGRRWRDTARWIGLGMFLVGALLLAFVFWKAITGLNHFAQPDYLSGQFNRITGDDITSRVQATVVVFGKEFLSVLYLLLTGYLASAIASKGIQFFAASEAVIDEAVEAGIEE